MPRRVHGTLSSTKSSVQQQVICCQHPNFPSGCSSLPQPSGCTHQHLQPPGQQGNCVCSVPGYHTISRSPPEFTGALVPHWQPCHQEEIVYIFVLPTTVFMRSLLRATEPCRAAESRAPWSQHSCLALHWGQAIAICAINSSKIQTCLSGSPRLFQKQL